MHLDRSLPGTIVHNPRSNMNNGVGYARPAARSNQIALGSDGIGAAMLDEFRVAYFRHREDDVTGQPPERRGAGWRPAGAVPRSGLRPGGVELRPDGRVVTGLHHVGAPDRCS